MEINEFELTYKDTDLLKQYYDMLLDEFKDPNELDSFENIVYGLENKTTPDISVIKVYLNENKELLGGITYDYYKDINSIGLQFIIVNPKYRGQDIGSIILKRMISLYKYNLKFVFIKVDKDSKYKQFWTKLGFKDTRIMYIKEALDGKDPCDYFELWYKPFNNSIFNEKDISMFLDLYKKHAIELPKKKESIPC